MGKLIIMGTPAPNIPNQNGTPPLSNSELLLQLSYWIADIHENLGDSKRAIEVLEHTRRIHEERILRLFITTTRTESELAFLKNTVERHAADLNGLGHVAHTADMLVRLALGILAVITGPTLIYLFRHVNLVWVK